MNVHYCKRYATDTVIFLCLSLLKMPNYADADYWDNRYKEDVDSPFDWLFRFEDVKDIIDALVPDKSTKILLVGSGNAPFSPDL